VRSLETRQKVVSTREERLRDANSSVYLGAGAGAGEVRAKSPLTRLPAQRNLKHRSLLECKSQSITIKP
jgi:hypothetical protein